MKRIFFMIILVLPLFMRGQTFEDALRYSRLHYYSTARTMGVAGSFAAMGGDFAAISYNPATLGNFWRNDFVLALGLDKGYSDSRLGGKKGIKTTNDGLSLESIGFVSAFSKLYREGKRNKSSWQTKNFAIGLNRNADFDNIINVRGTTEGSILEDPDIVEGVNYGPYEEIPIAKSQKIEDSGKINELVLAWGGNYKNKLLVGVSMGIPFLNFKTIREYEEVAPVETRDDPDFYFTDLKYENTYTTVGVGVNVKAGITYMAKNKFRLALAVHSPTYYSLRDDYNVSFNLHSLNYEFTPLEDNGYFNYRLKTPWRVIAGLGKIFVSGDLKGFVDFDVQYTGYNSARYNFRVNSSDEYDLENEKYQNRKIRNQLKPALNYKLGLELAYKSLRFRTGASLEESPFEYSDFEPTWTFSLGAGYRANNYYFDIAYLGYNESYVFYPYVPANEDRAPAIDIDKRFRKINFTVGFKF